MPRVYTKLSVVIADDAALHRRHFSIDPDVEENDDLSIVGAGSPGGLVVPNSTTAPSGVTVSLQAVSTAKQLVLLVDGSVNVFINDSVTPVKVSSTGADRTFVWGKFLLTGTAVTSLKLVSTSATASAKCLLGYAG